MQPNIRQDTEVHL